MVNYGTNPTTIRLIISHLRAWLDQCQMPNIEDIAPEASESLREAVRNQTNLGWDQWFRGRIMILWGELYNNDISKTNVLIERPSALQWGRTIVTQTFQYVLDSWYIRNKCEHDFLGNPIGRKKEKINEQIMWVKGEIKEEKNLWK
jgi:hypothetical protein